MTTRPRRIDLIALVTALLFVSFTSTLCADEKPPAASGLRQSIELSLDFIEAEGVAWIGERECASCHRVGMMIWCQAEAAKRGFQIDRADLQEHFDWSLEDLLSVDNKTGDLAVSRNLEGAVQLLLNRGHFAKTPEREKSYTTMIDEFLEKQAEDDLWQPGGQLPQQKRPLQETREVSAAWNTLGLLSIENPSPKVKETVSRAVTQIEKSTQGESTEWFVTRVLLAGRLNKPEQLKLWKNRLQAIQKSDGGWGWIASEPSDALATGMALYALQSSGEPATAASITAAQQYLIATQKEDGSWDVHGTKKNAREKIEETASYWGTTWATLGLLQTLPIQDSTSIEKE